VYSDGISVRQYDLIAVASTEKKAATINMKKSVKMEAMMPPMMLREMERMFARFSFAAPENLIVRSRMT